MYINHYIFLINFALAATYKQAAKKKLITFININKSQNNEP